MTLQKQNFYIYMSTRHIIYILCSYCGEEESVEQESFENGEDTLNALLNKKGWIVDESLSVQLCPDCARIHGYHLEAQ